MDKGMDGIWALADVLGGSGPKRETRTQATVTRIDNDGTTWVHLPGGVPETPINGISTASVAPGDSVQVLVGDGRATLVGNATSPAVGERKVVETVAPVAEKAENASAAAKLAQSVAESVEGIATSARAVANAVAQHFWTDGSGVHVTEVTQEEWEQEQTGANVLINAFGQLFRNGLNNILAIVSGTDPGIAIYDGDGNDAEDVVASFNKNGYQIGRTAGLHQIGTASAIEFYDESGQSVAYVSTEKFFSENVDVGGAMTIDSYAIREDTDGKLVIGLR